MPARTTPPPAARAWPPLLEREHELQAFADAVAAAMRGAGRLIVVRAPPGAGKTGLIAHARGEAARAGLIVLEARGAELEQGFAFGAVRQLLEPVVVGLDEDERAALFAGAAALAARIFDAGAQDESGADVSFATLHGLCWLVVHLADTAPVLVSVDDCHWADAQSLGFLNYLAHRVDGLAVTLALSGRPPEGGPGNPLWEQLTALPAAVALQPQPLSAPAVGALVRDRLGPDAPEDLCAACHAATGGNPLFLRELLAELDGAPSMPSADTVDTVGPAAVSRLVLHRLARLGDAVTELARAAAVLGDGADLRDAADVAGLPADAARRAADELVRAHVLEAAERLSFVHPIVAAATYEDLAPGERQRRHATAASRLAERGAPAERVAAPAVERAGGGREPRRDASRRRGQSAGDRRRRPRARRGPPRWPAACRRRPPPTRCSSR